MEKLWLNHYPEGVPHEVDTQRYASLLALFNESCRKFTHATAFENLGTAISYAELDSLSLQFAVFLQSLGLKKGARIIIMMPNLLQYPIALFAALRAGFVVVNTNPLYTCDELVHQINDSAAEAIIVLANFAHTVEQALPKTPSIKHIIVTEIGDMFPAAKRIIVNNVVRYIKKMIKPYHLPQALSFRRGLKSGQDLSLQEPQLKQDDIAFLQYTGGTTGVSKAAILTHGNMVANVEQAFSWISALHINEKDVIITALPLYHIFALTINCLVFFRAGAKNILITNPRDMNDFVKQLKHSGFTGLTGVNTLFNALLNHPKFKEIDFSKLKLSLAGGMALQKSVALRWKEVTHSRILEAYGLTETSPAVSASPMNLEDYNGSIGLPIPSTEISIRNDEGKELKQGEAGELCIRGPQVMTAYWNRPDETALVFWPDGFLRTGDIAKVDKKGFIYLVDRKKDMILVSGFNVYPNEVEQVIALMPEVLEVGVVGVIDNDSGERVKACIVKRDENLSAEAVIAHCRQHLTAYKIPKIIQFYTELPKTSVGKILRRGLR